MLHSIDQRALTLTSIFCWAVSFSKIDWRVKDQCMEGELDDNSLISLQNTSFQFAQAWAFQVSMVRTNWSLSQSSWCGVRYQNTELLSATSPRGHFSKTEDVLQWPTDNSPSNKRWHMTAWQTARCLMANRLLIYHHEFVFLILMLMYDSYTMNKCAAVMAGIFFLVNPVTLSLIYFPYTL